jgi:uracil-DNA glycosylase
MLNQVALTLVVGQYAHKFVLGKTRKRSLTETVRHFPEYGPAAIPLPHPSWRSRGWMKRHPWFEADLLPTLRSRVAELLDTTENT